MAASLCSGGLVAVPTETVYGLAAAIDNPDACRHIFAVKQRPPNDPLIVHVADFEDIRSIAEIPPVLEKLAAKFWPGPFTVILPRKTCVSDIITSGLNSVAVRIPAHPVMQAILRACRTPLAAPSANPFGYISPTRPEHVLESLGGKIPFIVDGGPCSIGIESTILDLTDPTRPTLLRPGGITILEMEKILGQKVHQLSTETAANSSPEQTIGIKAPGMLSRHYSPRKPLKLFLGEPPMEAIEDEQCAILLLKPMPMPPKNTRAQLEILSTDGSLETVAQNLFHALRKLDNSPATRLFAQVPDPKGIGLALLDRLNRAAKA